ncbi:MAG: amidohydrolase family protein, partial [Anaerotruncus massiliensis (ex Togo et al. 2019)]
PWSGCYGGAYDRFGLFGGDAPTIMAHCVHSTGEEIDLMQARGVFIAHCAQSNTNLASGVAPVRAYLDRGMKVGLGTDIAGGFSLSVFRAMADAVQASKLRWRLLDDSLRPLTVPEAFYLGTKGGGEFFGKVGSFEEGYEFDAVVLDDSGFRIRDAHPGGAAGADPLPGRRALCARQICRGRARQIKQIGTHACQDIPPAARGGGTVFVWARGSGRTTRGRASHRSSPAGGPETIRAVRLRQCRAARCKL